MKTLNFVKMLLLCVITLSMTSCGDDNYYTIQNSDEKLCSKTWVEEYTTEDGDLCRYQLEFTKNKKNNKELCSGKETTILYKTGSKETTERDFTWEWIDGSKEGLILNYGAGDIEYFENVWVREHYISGKLNSKIIMLSDEEYL